ncbi:hypothetical protein [Rhizobium sp. FY34]|uniref:hypothetical protein n=1 Tax=Rhizobium sp. FY34 TaxID=2562309 RepID=UPI0014853FE2|nr:hypothetical protein [Rhizobium sp. FY34]
MDKETDSKALLGTRVSEKVADLLTDIEKEPVPDGLLALAQQLQTALGDKLDKQSGE